MQFKKTWIVLTERLADSFGVTFEESRDPLRRGRNIHKVSTERMYVLNRRKFRCYARRAFRGHSFSLTGAGLLREAMGLGGDFCRHPKEFNRIRGLLVRERVT